MELYRIAQSIHREYIRIAGEYWSIDRSYAKNIYITKMTCKSPMSSYLLKLEQMVSELRKHIVS